MSQSVSSEVPVFTQVDIVPGLPTPAPISGTQHEQNSLLRGIQQSLDKQNALLEDLLAHASLPYRQRHAELTHWRERNPLLAKQCHAAAEMLSKVQTEYLASMVSEINANGEDLLDGEFVLNEFVDRYGPRLAQLNGVLHVLGQLGTKENAER